MANHRGRVQLNESFYQYTLHQQSQDPSLYSWPTPEQFGATVAWPVDRPNFRQGQDPQGPSKVRMLLRRTMTWSMWWTSSFEEAKSLDHDHLKLWTRLYFVSIAFSICLLSHCDRTWLHFISFSICLLFYCDETLFYHFQHIDILFHCDGTRL